MGRIPEFDGLVAHILDVAHSVVGDGLERVILYGSYVWGGRQPGSDIDVAILHADGVKVSLLDLMKASGHDHDHGDIQFYAATASKADSRRRFRICMDAKIANDGLVVFDSGRRFEPLDADRARTEVVTERFRHSAAAILRAMRVGRKLMRGGPDIKDMSTYMAMTVAKQSLLGAVFSLHAYLLDHDIDPSPKPLRWSVANLLDAAAWINPSWNARKPDAASLPPEHQFPEDRYLEDCPVTNAEAEQALLAAIRIHWKLREWRNQR